MANRFLDSFDHYVTSEISLKWTQNFSAQIQNTIFRTGSQALYLQTGGAGGVAEVSITIDYQTGWYVGFALYIPNNSSGLFGGGTCYELVSNGTTLFSLVVNPDGTVSLSCPANGGPYDTTTFALHTTTWYYIEIAAILGASGANVGVSAELRINSIVQLNPGTYQNTGVPTANLLQGNSANRHILTGMTGSQNGIYIDDVYINDNQGALGNNGFWGDVDIYCLFPASDSSPLDFSIFPTSPTTHYTKVNDNPPDGDTTYIYDDTPGSGGGSIGDSDNFVMQTLASFTGTVQAVQYLAYARKDDAGLRSFKHLVDGNYYAPGTGGVLGTPEFSLSEDYAYYRVNLDQNPSLNAGWTVSNFNSSTFGVGICE